MVTHCFRQYSFQFELVCFQKMEGRHSREEKGTDSLTWTALKAAPREEGWSETKTSEVRARQVS